MYSCSLLSLPLPIKKYFRCMVNEEPVSTCECGHLERLEEGSDSLWCELQVVVVSLMCSGNQTELLTVS